MNKSMDTSLWSLKPVMSVVVWWCVGIVLLVNVLWMLVGGALAARLNRAQNQEPAPLTYPTRFAFKAVTATLAVALLSYLLLAVDGTDPTARAVFLLFVGMGGVFTPLLWLRRNPLGSRQEMSRDARQQAWRQSRKLYLRTAGTSLLIAVGALTVAAHLSEQLQKTMLLFDVFTSGAAAGASGDTSHAPVQLLTFLVIVAASLAVPLVTACLSVIHSRVTARPAGVGLAQSFRVAALPVATVLLATYSLVVLLTVTQEHRLWKEMDKAIAH